MQRGELEWPFSNASYGMKCFLLTTFPCSPKWFPATKQQTCGAPVWIYPINSDFLPCLLCHCCYHNHSATSSSKCEGLMFFSRPFTCGALRAFAPYRVWPFFLLPVSVSARRLKLFKCSLLRTSCLITYLLDLLSRIFPLRDKVKGKCRLSPSQRQVRD